MISKRIIFEGRVQGVGFRYATKDLARGFDVRGEVRNLPDGTVELKVTGEEREVDSFIREISEESSVSHHIRHLRVEVIPPMIHVNGFKIEK